MTKLGVLETVCQTFGLRWTWLIQLHTDVNVRCVALKLIWLTWPILWIFLGMPGLSACDAHSSDDFIVLPPLWFCACSIYACVDVSSHRLAICSLFFLMALELDVLCSGHTLPVAFWSPCLFALVSFYGGLVFMAYGPDLEKSVSLVTLNKPNANEAKRQDQTR